MNTRVRITLDLSANLNQIVEELAALRGESKADVIRRSIELLQAAMKAKDDGMSVGAWKEEGDNWIEREFIGI